MVRIPSTNKDTVTSSAANWPGSCFHSALVFLSMCSVKWVLAAAISIASENTWGITELVYGLAICFGWFAIITGSWVSYSWKCVRGIISTEMCLLKYFTEALALFHIFMAWYFRSFPNRSQNSRGKSHLSLRQLRVKEECELKGLGVLRFLWLVFLGFFFI